MIVLVGVCVGGGGEREREKGRERRGRGRRGEGEGRGRGGGEKWCVCEVWGERNERIINFAATCSDMRDVARDAYNLQSPNYVVYSSVLLVKDV